MNLLLSILAGATIYAIGYLQGRRDEYREIEVRKQLERSAYLMPSKQERN